MNIVHVTFNLSSGGAERFVVDLSNEQSKHNNVSIITIKDDSDSANRFYLYDLSDDVKYKNLGIPIGGGFSFKTLWNVYKGIKEECPDVLHLHVHGVVNFCIIAIYLLCRTTTIVQTLHTDFKVGHSSFVYHFVFNTLGRFKLMRWAALSETNYSDMMKAYPYLKGRCIVNGRAPMVPTDKLEDTKCEISRYRESDKTVVYLHIARCHEAKNQDLLIDSFNGFTEKGYDAVLLIIGAGFDSERGQNLQKKASKKIHFLGTRTNISDYMLSSDVFCLSSAWEGMPITLLEASLAGIPIVSTPVGGAVEIVKNGKNGILSINHTTEEYIKALEYAYLHKEELSVFSEQMKANSPYTMEACAKKYLEFYKE